MYRRFFEEEGTWVHLIRYRIAYNGEQVYKLEVQYTVPVDTVKCQYLALRRERLGDREMYWTHMRSKQNTNTIIFL